MAVTYHRLDFASRDHEHVSGQWFGLLKDVYYLDGFRSFNVNEGHRTEARQRELIREKGLYNPVTNPTGAAAVSPNAPHIRTGREDHAIDADNAVGLIAACAKRGVRLSRPMASEPWHVEANATDLARYARKRRARIRREKAKAKAAKARKAAAKARKAAAKARAKVAPVRGVSGRGVRMIASFEGCVLHPYRDAVGVWTIGYGHTAGVSASTPVLKSQAEALKLLKRDLERQYAPAVTAAFRRYGVKPTQGEYDATVSAVYNLGAGILDPSRTFGGALKAHDMKGAADALLLYVMAGGQKLPGLVRRRQAERTLFLGR